MATLCKRENKLKDPQRCAFGDNLTVSLENAHCATLSYASFD